MESQNVEGFQDFLDAGIPAPTGLIKRLWGYEVLRSVLEVFKIQIRAPIGDREYEKLAWLFDRIAKQLGVPLSGSYPRVRPGDAVQ